jgi:hypothetical protein
MSQSSNTSNPSPPPFVPLHTQDAASQANTQHPPYRSPPRSSSSEGSVDFQLSPLPVQDPNASPWHPHPSAFPPQLDEDPLDDEDDEAPLDDEVEAEMPMEAQLSGEAPLSAREQAVQDRVDYHYQMGDRRPISFTPDAMYPTQTDPRNDAQQRNRIFMELSGINQTPANVQGRGSLTRGRGTGRRHGGTRRRYKKSKHAIKKYSKRKPITYKKKSHRRRSVKKL